NSIGGPRDEGRDGDVRFAEQAHAADLWVRLDARTQLPAASGADAHVRWLLCLLYALHAGAARSAHREAELSPSRLGADRAVRLLPAAAPERGRHLYAPCQRPLPLLGGRGRDLP